jgi:hypothetical protein
VLLLIGLASLAVGLLLSSTVWLVVSLVASALAAASLYRNRDRIAAARPARAPRHGRAADTAAPVEIASHREPAHDSAPTTLISPPVDRDVWVVDGRPRYHREACEIIRDQAVEAIPHSQASEDGFIPCSLCEPDRTHSARGV